MFLFAPCQVGAEKAFKSEVRRKFSDSRPAFSRPGFLTFKMSDFDGEDVGNRALNTTSRFAEHCVFARSASVSLGQLQGEDSGQIAEDVWNLVESKRFFVNRVHVYARDPGPPGQRGFEPGLTPEIVELHRILTEKAPRPKFLGFAAADPRHPALLDETVLDVVQVEANQYFVGVHGVPEGSSIQAYYPGGVIPISLPEDAVSRAWLKFEEGLRWSGFPIEKGSRCVDIGASPGGGSQVLLARGAHVLGVDPAEIDPKVLHHPNFTHIRGRINQTKRSLYRDLRWLIADMNVAPSYTIDVLEELVQRENGKIRGMLFTLKLFQWELADDLPACVNRIRRWGFDGVRVKQLAFNRREVMVAVQKDR